MRAFISWASLVVALIALLAASGAFYTVQETELVVRTQFGQPVGEPITQAGLHFKIPFIQEVNQIEKRVLQWDGPSTNMPTKDKLYINVDTFARWRIANPLKYFTALGDERRALSRLEDIIGSETRNTVARHQLVELIRTTKDRQPAQDETLTGPTGSTPTAFPPIQFGRVALEKEITVKARETLSEFGIDLLDVRFKRINYNPDVAAKIFDRMISERRQIADRYRSEGAGEAAKITGTRERDIRQIESEAYKEALTIQGKADAEAITIYAEAYNQSPVTRDFYEFQRTLEIYKTAFVSHTTLLLSTDDPFLHYLKGDTLSGATALPTPPVKAAPTPTPPPAPEPPAAPANPPTDPAAPPQ
jgi:membrane protease subunit HflC